MQSGDQHSDQPLSQVLSQEVTWGDSKKGKHARMSQLCTKCVSVCARNCVKKGERKSKPVNALCVYMMDKETEKLWGRRSINDLQGLSGKSVFDVAESCSKVVSALSVR